MEQTGSRYPTYPIDTSDTNGFLNVIGMSESYFPTYHDYEVPGQYGSQSGLSYYDNSNQTVVAQCAVDSSPADYTTIPSMLGGSPPLPPHLLQQYNDNSMLASPAGSSSSSSGGSSGHHTALSSHMSSPQTHVTYPIPMASPAGSSASSNGGGLMGSGSGPSSAGHGSVPIPFQSSPSSVPINHPSFQSGAKRMRGKLMRT